jgi:ArsR family transcriptional regulator
MEKISEKELAQMAMLFKALGDETRLKILYFIKYGEKCQCEIVSYIGLSQPAVSRHIQMLVHNGLLKLRKEGNKRFYSLTENAGRILFRKSAKIVL